MACLARSGDAMKLARRRGRALAADSRTNVANDPKKNLTSISSRVVGRPVVSRVPPNGPLE
jgi:hypothetical protein